MVAQDRPAPLQGRRFFGDALGALRHWMPLVVSYPFVCPL